MELSAAYMGPVYLIKYSNNWVKSNNSNIRSDYMF